MNLLYAMCCLMIARTNDMKYNVLLFGPHGSAVAPAGR